MRRVKTMKHVMAVLAVLAFSSVHVQAQDAESETSLVRAARMLDVETGEMLRDVTVLVEDGRIAAVNPSTVPDGAREVMVPRA